MQRFPVSALAVLLVLAASLACGTLSPVNARAVVPQPSSYYITGSDGIRLYVQTFGQGSPLVLLAGGPGLNPDYMKPVWEHLARHHRVIVLHERGTRKSKVPVVDAATMSVDDYVNDLNALRTHLGLERLVLVGHSWGGMLAMLYLSREPRHVHKVVLLDPGGLKESFMQPFQDRILRELTKNDRAMLKTAGSRNDPDLVARAMWPGEFYHRDSALATRSLTNGIWGQKRVSDLTLASYFANSSAMLRALREVKDVPVILIKGTQDPVGKSVAMTIKQVLPQTRIELIGQCGHFPWLEHPEQVEEFYNLLQNALTSGQQGPSPK